MQRWGKTAAGTQRWRCFLCKKTGTKKRPDRQRRITLFILKKWLTGNATLSDIAKTLGIGARALQDRLRSCWRQPCAAISKSDASVLVLDGTRIGHDCALLIILNAKTNAPIAWWPAIRESYASWKALLRMSSQQPAYVVCDGHSGLLKAVRERWPSVLVQRCLAHILRELRAFLTRRPKLLAGVALRILVGELARIETRRQKRRWIRKFFHWQRKYSSFLKEKTTTPDRHWHYTHRNLRRARTHILRALPNLFRFIKNCEVPGTSNQLEGGINSPLKDLVRKHRGMSTRRKLILASFYLQKRTKKPTRDFY